MDYLLEITRNLLEITRTSEKDINLLEITRTSEKDNLLEITRTSENLWLID